MATTHPRVTETVSTKAEGIVDTEEDKFREECAIFGIIGHKDASSFTVLGLHALQHRGQEASGIVSYDGGHFNAHRGIGHVNEVYENQNVEEKLKGFAAVGHNRYATTGAQTLRNVQPLFADFGFGSIAIAHNGNLTNALTLRADMVSRGQIFQSTSDTEVILHLIAKSHGNVENRLIQALHQVEGAYSLVALSRDMLIGVRDPLGVRPLCIGKLEDAYILASESCALDILGAEFIRDVAPGEMVVLECGKEIRSLTPFPNQPSRFCVFEYIYFARPDSVVEGRSVYEARRAIGEELARESGIEADVVVPVPDSGVPAAIGYAAQSQIPFELGIIRNHYVGRTFIQPTQSIRDFAVKKKHNANRRQLEGKRVILVDDSIVRGTTSRKIVEMVRAAGATEVHMRIASPPTTDSCFYGVDTPSQDKLMAFQYTVPEMAKQIGCDSLAFISMDGLYRAMGHEARSEDRPQFCDACFTSAYPTRLADQEDGGVQRQLSLLAESA